MLTFKYKTLYLLVIIPFIILAQPDKATVFDMEQLKDYSQTEKVYLHTDRDYYSAGGHIFFKAYVVNEALLQSTVKSKVLYVDLIDATGAVIESRNIKLTNGEGQGGFDLSSPIFKGGQYLLRGHTAYMKNLDPAFFFRKSIYIQGVNSPENNTNKQQQLQLQFFPEGGDLVIGLHSKVAIKAQDVNGLGQAVEGEIINNKGEKILDFSTDQYGFGLFELNPKQGIAYFGIIKKDGTTKIKEKLPLAQATGGVMNFNVGKEKINLNLAASNTAILKGGTLVAHTRGGLIWEKQLTTVENLQFEIALTDLPSGIIHFTLFDKEGQAQAERLVFNHYGFDDFNIDFSTEEETYGKREKVQLKLDVYNDEGDALPANLSVSITDQYLSKNIISNYDIRSYLLLGADIKGFVAKPARFFEDTAESRKAMDLLMMTHGWRRFKWKDIFENKKIVRKHKAETSLGISGKVTEIGKPNKTVQARGFLSKLSANFSIIPFETESDGSFYINDVNTQDSIEMFIQAVKVGKKNKTKKQDSNQIKLTGDKNIDILIDKKLVFSDKENDSLFIARVELETEALRKLEEAEKVNYTTSIWDNGFNIDLEGVEVKEKRIEKVVAYYEQGMLYKKPNTRMLISTLPAIDQYDDVYDILRRMPGVKLEAANAPEDVGNKYAIIIRGEHTGLSKNITMSNSAKFMVNGGLVSTPYAESIPPSNIAFIDILGSLSQLNLYGGLGSNGLVMIYLKPPGERIKTRKEGNTGILNFVHTGYHTAREFYAPNYENPSTPSTNVDHRITLHWTPMIKVNESGEAYIEFFTADRSTIYDIQVEGISQSGTPIIAKSKFMVK
jgi:hypothetical protein